MIRAMIINMLVTMVASKVVTSFITMIRTTVIHFDIIIAPLVAQDPADSQFMISSPTLEARSMFYESEGKESHR